MRIITVLKFSFNQRLDPLTMPVAYNQYFMTRLLLLWDNSLKMYADYYENSRDDNAL